MFSWGDKELDTVFFMGGHFLAIHCRRMKRREYSELDERNVQKTHDLDERNVQKTHDNEKINLLTKLTT